MKNLSKKNRWVMNEYRYFKIKALLYLRNRFTLDSKIRKRREEFHKDIFSQESHLRDKEDCSIPDNKYYKPVAIIATDLVSKEDLDKLKNGISKFIYNNTTHKFHSSFDSIDRVLKAIDKLDDTYSAWSENISCGRFDFKSTTKLSKEVDYFDIKLRKYNSSFIAVEVHIYITEYFEQILTELIKSDYKESHGYIVDGLVHSSKENGAKKSYSVIHYNNELLKSEKIYETINDMKYDLFNRIQKDLPLVLTSKKIIPPGVNIFNTNILPSEDDEKTLSFLSSVGIRRENGQYLCKFRKLFFKTSISNKIHPQNIKTDMILLVNEENHNFSSYYNFNFYIVRHFEEEYKKLYRCILANVLFDEFATICVDYKMKNRKIKIKRRNLKNLLRIRYCFESEMTMFKEFVNNVDWENEMKSIKALFKVKSSRAFYNYKSFTILSFVGHNKLHVAINELVEDIDVKISVVKHLDEFKSERRNFLITFIMLLLSTLTLYLVILPEHAAMLNEFMRNTLRKIVVYFVSKG